MISATEETTREARIAISKGLWLEAEITIPRDPVGLVVFAHGIGSSRRSVRNRFVARELNPRRFATVLTDLLTEDEARTDAQTHGLRMNIPLLAKRVEQVFEWSREDPELAVLPLGLFGASTGAAAALTAAAVRPDLIHAVVSRGGRPDLAGANVLPRVTAPTLLIVGGEDDVVLDLNRRAYGQMTCERRLEVVPGATHLFEEPGTLEQVATLAAQWFAGHLSARSAA